MTAPNGIRHEFSGNAKFSSLKQAGWWDRCATNITEKPCCSGGDLLFNVYFLFYWFILEASWFSLEQNSCCSGRQAFIYFSRLHQVWKGTGKTALIWFPHIIYTPYNRSFSSSLSDLMKFTEVEESLSTTTVLFQRKSTCFKGSFMYKCYIIVQVPTIIIIKHL